MEKKKNRCCSERSATVQRKELLLLFWFWFWFVLVVVVVRWVARLETVTQC